jgi:hypothetical protein
MNMGAPVLDLLDVATSGEPPTLPLGRITFGGESQAVK